MSFDTGSGWLENCFKVCKRWKRVSFCFKIMKYQNEDAEERNNIFMKYLIKIAEKRIHATGAVSCEVTFVEKIHEDPQKTRMFKILFGDCNGNIIRLIMEFHEEINLYMAKFTLKLIECLKTTAVTDFLSTGVRTCSTVHAFVNRNLDSIHCSVIDTDINENGSVLQHSEAMRWNPNISVELNKTQSLLNDIRFQKSSIQVMLCMLFSRHPSISHRNHLLKHLGKLCVLTTECTKTDYSAKTKTVKDSKKIRFTVFDHYENTKCSTRFLIHDQEYEDVIRNRINEYFSVNEYQRVLKNITDPKTDFMFFNNMDRYSEIFVFPIIRCNDLEYSFKQILDGTRYLSSEIMRFEHHRLSTFANFEVTESPSALLMAKAGWYATGNENETKTFCCLVVNRVWRRDEDPLVVHKNFQPDCQFIQGGNLGQVAIHEDQSQQITESNAYLETTEDPYRTSSVSHDTDVFEKAQDCNSDAGASFSKILNSPQDWNLPSTTSNVEDRPEESINSDLNLIDHHSQLIQRTRQMMMDSRHTLSCSWSIDCPSRTSLSTIPVINDSQDNVESFQRRNESQIVIGKNVKDSTSTTNGVTEIQEKIKNQSLHSNTEDKENAEDRPKNNANYREPVLPPLVLEKPKHAEYGTVAVRASSFSGFPIGSGKTPKEFAIGGFYYRGFGDRTACFQCGINLQSWGPEDDVFVEHARHSPFCQYVRQLKGDDFVRLVLMVTQTPEVTQDQDNIVKKLKEMGFEENEISSAITRTSSNNGILTLQKALDNVLLSKNAQSNSIRDLSHNKSIENSGNKTESASHNDSIASGIDTKYSSLVTSTEDQFLCKICLDERVGVVFIPCGHIATCYNCAKPLRKCPMCRAVVIEKINTEI